jgi:ribosomal protein L4
MSEASHPPPRPKGEDPTGAQRQARFSQETQSHSNGGVLKGYRRDYSYRARCTAIDRPPILPRLRGG